MNKTISKAEKHTRFLNRFWDKVNKTTTCWLFQGSINDAGYGEIYKGYRRHAAHRLSFEIMKYPIPENLVIDHKCRVRHCVNPDHLQLLTIGENAIINSIGPTALNKQKTHCIRGHELSAENIYKRRTGRQCKLCVKFRMAQTTPSAAKTLRQNLSVV